MTPVFADTSFFIAFLCEDDMDHENALSIARGLRRSVITSQWVLAELGSFLRRPAQRERFAPFVKGLSRNSGFQILPADAASFDAGVQLYASRPDKGWSFTDCISITQMQRLGLSDVLTTDHHFEQAGFRIVALR